MAIIAILLYKIYLKNSLRAPCKDWKVKHLFLTQLLLNLIFLLKNWKIVTKANW